MKTFEDHYISSDFIDIDYNFSLVEFHCYEDDKWATVSLGKNEVKKLIEHLQELVEDED